MSFLRTYPEINGNSVWNMSVYKCDRCGVEMPDCNGRITVGEDEHYCYECAFRKGLIDGSHYGKIFGYLQFEFAGVNPYNAEIEFVKVKYYKSGRKKGEVKNRRKFTWEMNDAELRRSGSYANLKRIVFKRDEYRCIDCGSKENKLNIHHIKHFAKFKDLRLDENNCVTLCVDCHKRRHREGDLDG